MVNEFRPQGASALLSALAFSERGSASDPVALSLFSYDHYPLSALPALSKGKEAVHPTGKSHL